MHLAKRLDRWRAAGLLDQATADRILAYEAERRRPLLLYALGGLGSLTVAIGLVALVAANWEALGEYAKLGGDLFLGLALALALLAADRRGTSWLRESLLVLFYGYVLASIGLIAQVYQLGGRTADALIVWSLLSAYLMTHARSLMGALVWLLGLHLSWYVVLADHGERLLGDELAASLALVPLVLCLAASASPAIEQRRPQHAHAAGLLGWLSLFGLAFSIPQLFYLHVSDTDARQLVAPVAVGLGAAAALALLSPALLRPFAGLPGHERARLGFQLGLAFLGLLGAGALLVPHDHLGLLAALSFIAVWALAGYLAWLLGLHRLLHLATALVAVRVLVVYFEVFGSLLDTGLGLIGGGVLTLLLTWVWVRQSRRLAPPPASAASPPAGPAGDETNGAAP